MPGGAGEHESGARGYDFGERSVFGLRGRAPLRARGRCILVITALASCYADSDRN